LAFDGIFHGIEDEFIFKMLILNVFLLKYTIEWE
jgi:hypothetical protein